MSDVPSIAELQAENARLRRELEDSCGRQWAVRFLDDILDAVGDPIFIKDREHRWIAFNKAFCDFLGYSREQLLGKSDYDFFPKERAEVYWKKDEEVFASRMENTNVEEITDAAGNLRVISTRKSVLDDGFGPRMLVGVTHDVTDMQATERRLHDNLSYLNCIIENLPMCVKLVDAKGTILDINPAGCTMMGSSAKGEITGHTMDESLLEEEKDAYHRFNEKVCSGVGGTHQYRVRDLGGSVRTLTSVSVPIPKPDGSGFIQLAITRDLTEDLKREAETLSLQHQLQQAHKLEAVGTLAGGIAHDFNNILGAILGYSELVHQNLADPRMCRDLEQVVAAALRAKDLIRQILTFSRLRQEELRPQRLQPVVHEALRLLRASIPANIDIVEQVDPDCGPVLADGGQIHQILMNLCTNAYFAMREKGGTLRVSMRPVPDGPSVALGLPPGKYIAIEVEDTGTGMTPAVLERVFEPYFTTKGKDEGTGLGLSVVHGIVKSHGGTIQVRSTPGSGSTFTVVLPQVDEFDALAESVRESAPRGSERILMIDDEEVLAAILTQNLERLGYSVTPFSSSEDALKAFLEAPGRFDLVITDLSMPKLTGLQLARELLRHRPTLPVILCTGYAETMTLQTAKNIGIRDVLTKPLLTLDLAKAIRRLLD